MKILLGKDIRSADLRTMEREPVASIDLMERAAVALEAEIVAAAEAPVSVGKGKTILISLIGGLATILIIIIIIRVTRKNR